MSSHISLKRIFNHFNRLYFDCQVPADTKVLWLPLNGNNGEYQSGEIRIDTTLQGSSKLARLVMLHEMIHARYPKAGHGKVFKAERQRLWEIGAFDKLV